MTQHELQVSGVLQEANRRFFHRLGLSFGFAGGRPVVVEVDPGHGLQAPDAEKARQVAARMAAVRPAREARFGSAVQPVVGHDDAVPAEFLVDGEDAQAVMDAAIDRAARLILIGSDDPAQAARAAVIDALALIWSAAVVEVDGAVLLQPSRLDEDDVGSTGHEARMRWLVRALLGFDDDGERHPGLVEQHGELYPDELAELEVLAERVEAGDAGADDHLALERLFGLAQAGMRFFRGDEAERKRWQERSEATAQRIEGYRDRLATIDRLLSGDVVEVEDPDALTAELDERAEPHRQTIADLEAQLATARAALAPIEAARARVLPLKDGA